MRADKTNVAVGTFVKSVSKIVLVLVLLASAALLTSCQTPSMPVDENLTGTYTLVSVDGYEVPAVVTHGDTDIRVESGRFDINPDYTCRSTTLFGRASSTDLITREVDATYTLQGSTLHMQWQGAGRTIGTVEDNTFTMNNEGMVFVYEKLP
ncbi:MAG: hypothetical protein JW936_00960 [Sedimentisphaerales bacterium]|nr:hypothetical protein [Sedimentisphaerales bacterium]